MKYKRSLDYVPGLKGYMWEGEINGIGIEIWGNQNEPDPSHVKLVEYIVHNADGVCGEIRQMLSHSFGCSALVEIEELYLDKSSDVQGAMARFRIPGSAEDELAYPFVEYIAETNGNTVFRIIVQKV